MGFWTRILGVDPDRLEERTETDVTLDPVREDAEFHEKVMSVLEQVRPSLHADGGDIELVEVVGNSARVRLVGACDGCPSAALTLRFGIEKKLREEIAEFEDLIPI